MTHSSNIPPRPSNDQSLTHYAVLFFTYCMVYWTFVLLVYPAVYGYLSVHQQMDAWKQELSGVHVHWASNLSASLMPSFMMAVIFLGVGVFTMLTPMHRLIIRKLRRWQEYAR